MVREIQSELKTRTGVGGRLLQKRDDPKTWMEIYEGVEEAAAFEQCLASAVQAVNFATALEAGGVRHLECLEDRCA